MSFAYFLNYENCNFQIKLQCMHVYTYICIYIYIYAFIYIYAPKKYLYIPIRDCGKFKLLPNFNISAALWEIKCSFSVS